MNISENLKQHIRDSVGMHGAAVVGIVCRGESRTPVLEIFIDNELGVTLELCREVSRGLQTVLDKELPESKYRLTVSSPGLDRPLVHPWQFKKHVGRTLDVTLAADTGNQSVTGRLTSLSETGVTLELGSGSGDMSYAFDKILSATVRPPW